jgi:hypothetical protein
VCGRQAASPTPPPGTCNRHNHTLSLPQFAVTHFPSQFSVTHFPQHSLKALCQRGSKKKGKKQENTLQRPLSIYRSCLCSRFLD